LVLFVKNSSFAGAKVLGKSYVAANIKLQAASLFSVGEEEFPFEIVLKK